MPGHDTSAAGLDRSCSSTELRKRGNTYFVQARSASCSQRERLLSLALGLYRKALDAASDAVDCATAHKNIAATLGHLSTKANKHGPSSSSLQSSAALSQTAGLLLEAVEHRCKAYQQGCEAGQCDEWLEEAWDSIGSSCYDLMSALSAAVQERPAGISTALNHLDVLTSTLPEEMQAWLVVGVRTFLDSIKTTAAALIDPAAATARGSAVAAAEPDWRSCLMLVAETKRLIIETIAMAIECECDDEVEHLCGIEDDLWDMACRCESTQARLQGEQVLKRVLAATPQPGSHNSSSNDHQAQQEQQQAERLDGVLAAIDLFKSAALLAREKDFQAEAHALSRLGHTYKVCGAILNPTLQRDPLVSRSAEERSRAAFLQVLGLVDALPHRISLMMEHWYREARDAISEYQRTTAAEETARREKERAPIKEELRGELMALYAAADRGWVELLKHCYTQHPPLNPANRLTSFTHFSVDTGKEVLRKAILAYHPDKQTGQASSSKWQVLAEEITKTLTQKYEAFK